MSGGYGRDQFIFDGGRDMIRDFDAAQCELIRINVDGFDSYDDIMAVATQQGDDAVFTLGQWKVLTLDNVQLSELSADHFFFA